MRRDKSPWALFLVLLFGSIAGSAVGQILSNYIPVLGSSVAGGLEPPVTLDLVVLTLTFGVRLAVNAGTAIGIIIALMLYFGRR